MKKIIVSLTLFVFVLVTSICLLIFLKNDNKSSNVGNNKTIKEIEQYLLNVNSYKAEIDVNIKSNKNENNYTLKQEVSENFARQTVIEPESLANMEIIYQNGSLTIRNTELNVSKVYENYPYIENNTLFLTDFIKRYREADNKETTEENGTIKMEIENSNTSNNYNKKQTLTLDKNTLKPISLEVQDMNNETKVYILYKEIELNI